MQPAFAPSHGAFRRPPDISHNYFLFKKQIHPINRRYRPVYGFHAGLVASMETVGGLMLILGLFTRFFASSLSITMVVALLTADTADFLASWGGASELSPTDVTAFTFLLFLLWLVFYGAGKLSLDALLRGILRAESTTIASLSPESP